MLCERERDTDVAVYSAKRSSSGSVSCQVGACCTVVRCWVVAGFLLCLGGMLSTAEGGYENRNRDLGRNFAAVLLKFISLRGLPGGGFDVPHGAVTSASPAKHWLSLATDVSATSETLALTGN